MSRIAILPPAVADQIAAGEVVERPFSVVKELVENAIDAGATSIDITIEDGGKGLIRVGDDGSGMTQPEALLALERHATSKIRSATDLVGVRSFGFRGEALPSISSVSDLELETAVADGPGVLVRSDAGVPKLVSEVSRRRGTTVSVASLFHNVPARKKFMRSERSEWRAIHDAIVVLALTRLTVRFHVVHDGRQALSLPAAGTLRERAAQVWGAAFADRLLDVDDVSGTTHTSGLVERPADVGTATRRIHLRVNGRAVRDNGLVRAAEAAYRSTVPSGVRPSLLLSVVVPGDSVDVNVHPAKAEIRFQDRWPVERCVETAVRRALGTLESGAHFERNHHFFPGAAARGGGWTTREIGGDAGGFLRQVRDDGPLLTSAAAMQGGGATALATSVETASGGAPGEQNDEIDVPYLVQLHRTYLLFERDDGLVLIDQHSAHERVLFEKFMSDMERGDASGQRLLFPLTLHLGPAEAEAFEQNRPALEKLGFETEGFGGNTLLVRSVPMPHPRFDAERCLRDTLAALTGDRSASSGAKHERLAATVACKAAIKAGDQLTQPEMRALFVALARTQLPAHDVHGRAVVVHLSWEEVERRFGRR